MQGGGAIQGDKNNMVWRCKAFDLTLFVVLFCPVQMCSKWIFWGLDLFSLFLMTFYIDYLLTKSEVKMRLTER